MTPPPAAPPDADPTRLLVERIQAGDNPAGNFEKLFRRYRLKVFLYFRSLSRDAVECEDLTQETFLRVYRHIGSLQDASRFDSWLQTMMINTFRNRNRSRKTGKRDHLEMPLEDLGDDADRHPALASPLQSPLEEALAQELEDALCRAIQDLPTKMRRCLLLRHYQGLEYREIAELMGISLGAVSAHLHQARKRLVEALRADPSTLKGTHDR